MTSVETNGVDSLKRKIKEENEEADIKKVKTEDNDPLKFLPFRAIQYDEQLEKKKEEVENCLKTFHTSFPKQYPELADWHENQLMKWFRIETIKPSPKIDGYRNKCELTIGVSAETGKLGAGVRISEIENETVEINLADETFVHLPKPMITLAQEFTKFLEPYNTNGEKCPYKYLYIRSNNADELMVIVIVTAENDEGEDFQGYKSSVVQYFTENSNLKDQIKSLYLQARPPTSKQKAFEIPFHHAWGEEHLNEEIMDTKILMTPSLFFNINTPATELVYQQVVDLADCRKKKTLIIDLFCGSGILSMIMSKKARQVVAIDPSKWNIKQAKKLAAHNNIKNIQFAIGKPEEALPKAWSSIVQAEEVIIICDPPSNSKPHYYINLIGDMNNLTKLIYLNSNSKANVVKNLMTLTEAALLPVRVVPIDIAPYTLRYEMVILCKKFNPYQISRSLEEPPAPMGAFGGPPMGGGFDDDYMSWGGGRPGGFFGAGGFGRDRGFGRPPMPPPFGGFGGGFGGRFGGGFGGKGPGGGRRRGGRGGKRN